MAAAPIVNASGTSGQVVGTPLALVTTTTAGWYQAIIDLNLMSGAEVVNLELLTIVLSAGTAHRLWSTTYGPGGSPSCPVVVSPIVGSDISITFQLTQTGGTTRAFPWKLLQT